MVSARRPSEMDFYSPVSRTDGELYTISMFDWYRLPLDEKNTVLVVSTSSGAATLWVVAYTVLITMIFMAACELATLLVLTFFRVGRSGTRHAMLVAYYNAGSPSRILPIMVGYIYNALIRCRKNKKWAVDWTAVTASCLLFSVAFSLISGDMLTKFFLGGRALVRGNVAQVNPDIVFYPDFELPDDDNTPNSMFDAYKGSRAPAVYQAITRKTSTGFSKLHNINNPPISFKEDIGYVPDRNTTQRKFWYRYGLSGYEMGLRDAPGLLITVEGHCETYHAKGYVWIHSRPDGPLIVIPSKDQKEDADVYPFWNFTGDTERSKMGNEVPLDRENYTAPWVFFHLPQTSPLLNQSEESGGWAFQLVPHTAHRLSRTPNSKDRTDLLSIDPWYETEDNPEWVEGKDLEKSAYNMRYRVKRGRPPIRCIQNDTYSYNGETVKRVQDLGQLESHGLKLSPFVQFVLKYEFAIPVFAPILGYVPIGSLASAVHYVPNQRRLDAEKANISTDFRELVEIAYVYSREVIRNTALLFPSLHNLTNPDPRMKNIASNMRIKDAGFLIDSHEVAALSVITLIATPTLCVFLWIVVLSWICLFNSQTKLDNSSAAGRHGLRRSALQATHLYLFLDEQLSQGRKWSGRQTNAPYIRNLDDFPQDECRSILVNPTSEKSGIEAQTTSIPPDPFAVSSEFSKPKLMPVVGHAETDGIPEGGNQGWRWVKENIFRMRSSSSVQYEVTMTRTWNPRIAPVKREDIREDV